MKRSGGRVRVMRRARVLVAGSRGKRVMKVARELSWSSNRNSELSLFDWFFRVDIGMSSSSMR